MVLHVVLRRVGEDHRRPRCAYKRTYSADCRVVVKNLEVAADGAVPSRAHEPSRGLRLLAAGEGGLADVHFRASKVPVGKIAVVDIPSPLSKKKKGACRSEFDIVWVREDCEYGRHVGLELYGLPGLGRCVGCEDDSVRAHGLREPSERHFLVAIECVKECLKLRGVGMVGHIA